MMPERWSAIPAVQQFVGEHEPVLMRAGIFLSVKKQLQWGTQFQAEGQGGTAVFNVYYSRKKGISVVDSSHTPLAAQVIGMLREGAPTGQQKPSTAEKKQPASGGGLSAQEDAFSAWTGTDESGKGDYFGPLVVAGFCMRREEEPALRKLGVTDSKQLTSTKIHQISAALWRSYRSHISLVAPSVQKYNELYQKIGNLNRLLAWGHARAIANLLESTAAEEMTVDGAVADQFGNERYIKNALKKMRDITLVQRPKGESNTAVAAASILARAHFENSLAQLGKQWGLTFPPGCSSAVTSAARRFIAAHGRGALEKVAKVHFKTTRTL